VKLVPPRGTILDRNGKILVDNRPGNAIGIRPMDVPPGELRPLIRRLARVLHVTQAEIRRQLREHAANPYDLVVIKEDVSRRVFSYILERQATFPGVEVQKNYLRDYPGGDLAAQLLGYTGEISAQQLKDPRFSGYVAGDVIGQSGVEYTYDRWLRGVDGSLRVEVDAALTIDRDHQHARAELDVHQLQVGSTDDRLEHGDEVVGHRCASLLLSRLRPAGAGALSPGRVAGCLLPCPVGRGGAGPKQKRGLSAHACPASLHSNRTADRV